MEETRILERTTADPERIAAAYAHCRRIATSHYENFPVGSLLIPKRHRPAVAAVYAFARHADDIVDEGSASQIERIQQLDGWREELLRCTSDPERPEFVALGDTISRYGLSLEPFLHLLDAFEQDATKERYETFDEVLHYCTRSANPVGRIILGLFGRLNADSIPPSDSLCTGLQLANFWQDVSVDILKPRVYLPAEDMERFGVTERDLQGGVASPAFKQLMAFEVERAREYFYMATALFRQLPLQLRLELTAVWRGGMAILRAIERQDYDVLRTRPSLTRMQYLRLLAGSIFPVPVHRP